MDPEKILKVMAEYLIDWSRITLLTLVSPGSQFSTVASSETGRPSVLENTNRDRDLWLSPRLLRYTVFSIIIGITLNSLIPNRLPAPEYLAQAIVIFCFWLLYGSVMHSICYMLKGRGSFLETLTVSMQVLATLYVLSSFLGLLAASISSMLRIESAPSRLPPLGEIVVEKPIFYFFTVAMVVQGFYIPWAMRRLHRFGWIRTAVIAVVPYCFTAIAVAIFLATGILTAII